MIVRIAARKSDLARLQARMVGRALKEAHPSLEIRFEFRESLGDRNLEDPLWKMPEKGVFTEDFVDDLREGRCDLVVHSWKDLPTEERPFSEIVATLPRADLRDLLLVREDRWAETQRTRKLRIYSSSPRREYNLKSFLPTVLPGGIQDIEFLPVRGNIPTRLRKLMAEDAPVDALIVAKAAVDRLLTAPADLGDVYADAQRVIRDTLAHTRWMVLPLQENPTAAAQGALAIEIRRDRDDLRALFEKIHCARTFAAVQAERAILKAHGGGCHQKIGVSCVAVEADLWVTSVRGQRTDGRILHTWSLAPEPGEVPQKRGPFWHLRPWPRTLKDADLFTRHEIAAHPPAERAWLIAKEDALPQSWTPPADKVLWAAGTTTWTKLARRGLWCHGSSEGLGSPLVPLVPWIEDMTWARLTHEGAPEENGGRKVATYRLEAKTEWPDFSTFNVFFWPSGEHAREALKRFPDLAVSSGSRSSSISHACGAGATRLTCRHLGLPVKCYLSHKDWLKSLGIDD